MPTTPLLSTPALSTSTSPRLPHRPLHPHLPSLHPLWACGAQNLLLPQLGRLQSEAVGLRSAAAMGEEARAQLAVCQGRLAEAQHMQTELQASYAGGAGLGAVVPPDSWLFCSTDQVRLCPTQLCRQREGDCSAWQQQQVLPHACMNACRERVALDTMHIRSCSANVCPIIRTYPPPPCGQPATLQ